MTREEKEQIGKYVLQMARYLKDGCYQQEILLKAAHIIDEALEQESTLDKIRSEIEGVIQEETIIELWCEHRITISKLDPDDVFEIIDKYRTESEE